MGVAIVLLLFIVIILIKTEYALIFLIFTMMLSPEIPFGGKVAGGRPIVARIDDFLIAALFFTWLIKMAMNRKLGLFVKTPVNNIMFAFIALWIFSTSLGIMRGNVNLMKGFFYVLRYVEYYMLFFLVINNIKEKKQIKILITAGLITCLIVAVYGYSQIGSGGRLFAPFDVREGSTEPATLGGYILIIMSLCLAFFINSNSTKTQVLSAGIFGFMISPFLYTLSRGSWVAFPFLVLTLLILTKRRKLMFTGVIISGIVLSTAFLPKVVLERAAYTFSESSSTYRIGLYQIDLEASAATRVSTWKAVFLNRLPERPIIGHGVTGVGFRDAQIPLVAGETGTIGLVLFFWLLITLFRTALRIYKTEEDNYFKSLALGYLACLVALILHGFTVSTFIIIRIMEPFWFLTAIIMIIPRISEKERAIEVSA